MSVDREAQDAAPMNPPQQSNSGATPTRPPAPTVSTLKPNGDHPTGSHLDLALEAGQMGAWEWDIDTGAVHWSPQEERLYGLAEGTFDGTVDSYRNRVHPDDREASWRLVQARSRAKPSRITSSIASFGPTGRSAGSTPTPASSTTTTDRRDASSASAPTSPNASTPRLFATARPRCSARSKSDRGTAICRSMS